jgi:NADP-reducing hydrogenase subunit HndA
MGYVKEATVVEKENGALFDQIAEVIEAHRDTPGSLIQVLHQAQEIFGYLPLELQQFISDRMDIPLAKVSGVVSFYSFFSTAPRGEHTIRVCLGTACYVRGGKKIVDYLLERLGVELGGTTPDQKFTFEIARCIGACGLAPAMMIDDTVYKQVNVNKIEKILEKY